MIKSRFFLIFFFIEIYLNSFECLNSCKYEIKFSSSLVSYSYDVKAAFKAVHKILEIENLAYIKCISKCNLANCSSVVITKYNSSYSSCLGFNDFIDINTDVLVINNQISSQKVLYTLTTGLSSSFATFPSNTISSTASTTTTASTITTFTTTSSTTTSSSSTSTMYTTTKAVINLAGTNRLTIQGAHSLQINSFALLPNGNLASGSNDNSIKIWDTTTGAPITNLTGHTNFVNELVVLNNGDLASASTDGKIKIWQSPGWTLKYTLSTQDMVYALGLLSNGYLVCGLQNNDIQIWNGVSGSSVSTKISPHADSIFSLATFSNGYFATGSKDTTIKVWYSNLTLIFTLNGHSNTVNALVFLSNGNLASGSQDNTIKIWNMNVGTLMFTITGHGGAVNSLILLSNNDLASGSSDYTVKVWDTSNWTPKLTIPFSAGSIVYSLALLGSGELACGVNTQIYIYS